MKTEITFVPKDECPLDILVSFGEKTQNAWIFISRSVVEKLKSTADWRQPNPHTRFQRLHWNKTKDCPATSIVVEDRIDKIWMEVKEISTNNISFKKSYDPEEIFFLKMEK